MINSYFKKTCKLFAAILAVSLSISMTACSEEESDGLDNPAETQATTTATATQKADTSETDSSETEITTTTAATTQSSTAESTQEDNPHSNNVDPSIIPYEVEMGIPPRESYNTFLLKVKNNMHILSLNKDSSNGIDKNGVFYIDSPFKESWENEHNITFTELSPDNCKKNSEYLVAETNEINSCKLKVENGIYVSKFTYNGTEYKMRLGRTNKYSEREIQAYQLAMKMPDDITYFFMTYEDGEYIVYPFMYSFDSTNTGGRLTVCAITPIWDLIGEYMDEVSSVLDMDAQLDDKLDMYLAEQPDWAD